MSHETLVLIAKALGPLWMGGFLIIVLIVAAVISGFLGELSDALLILVIILLNAFFGRNTAEESQVAAARMERVIEQVERQAMIDGAAEVSVRNGLTL